MIDMEQEREKKRSDIRSYLRLLGYLKGCGGIVALVFVCIVLEGVFTVVTIASTKPMLNLLMHDRFLDKSPVSDKEPFEISRQWFRDEVIAIKGAGVLKDAKRGENLRDELLQAAKPPTQGVVVDLSSVRAIGPAGWAALLNAGLAAANEGTTLAVVLPAGSVLPVGVAPTTATEYLLSDSARAGELRKTYLDAVTTPVITQKSRGGLGDTIKKRLLAGVMPTMEKVEHYCLQSSANKFRVLGGIVGVMVVCAVLMVVFSFGAGYLSAYLANKVVQKLRNHLYGHMVELDLGYFTANSTGTLISIVLQDVNMVDNAIEVLFSTVIKTPIQVAMLVFTMFVLSPSLTLFSFSILPVVGVLLFLLGRRVRKTSSRIQRVRGALATVVEETFSGMRVVKSFNMEKNESERFDGESRRIFRMSMRAKSAEEIGTGLTQFTGAVTVAVMLLAGGYHILLTGHMSASDFMVFIALLMQVFRPLKGTSRTNSRIQKGMAGCDRVFKVIDTEPAIRDREGAREIGPLKDGIVFDQVEFRYRPDLPPVLQDISLTVKAGHAVALVGETGSGKSTLVNLLPRFYDPSAGSVRYDGVDLRDIRVASLRGQIALISQEVILFDDTIANNIAYGCGKELTREQIEEAARAANAHRFIAERLPQGYDTMIGSRGARLSGGERQRIAIARAFLKNAPILILDEATSALDSETEALIQEALLNVIRGRTVFVIAHRLSTIQNCDEIFVMDGGRFVEHGTHDELLAMNGRYARFHQLQFGRANGSAATGNRPGANNE